MFQWFESVAGSTYASAMLWTLAALVLLLVVLVLIKIVRSLTFGTFVAGGRNRKTRLAVMDAAAVDSQRRLVLVRRDDVEHLVLIGGANDLVIEQNIRLAAPLLRPGAEDAPRQFEERARPAPVVVEPAHAPRPPVQPQRPVDPVQIAEARPQDQRPVEQLRRPEARPAEHHPQQAARPVVAPLRLSRRLRPLRARNLCRPGRRLLRNKTRRPAESRPI